MSSSGKKRGLSAFLEPQEKTKKERGIGAFVDAKEKPKQEEGKTLNQGVVQVLIKDVKPSRFQARKKITEENIKELAESIKSQGVIQPLIVRQQTKGYELMAGERRLRASKLAGLEKVPVLIRDDSEESALKIGLIENLQREDLNPLEEAEGIFRLQKEFGLSQQALGSALGKSRSAISNSLRLLQLQRPLQNLLLEAKLTMGHARSLLPLPPAAQEQIAQKIIKNGLSVRQAEKLAQSFINKRASKPKGRKDPNIINLENELSNSLSSQVTISHRKNGSGKISFTYRSLDQLEELIKPLKKE